MVTTSPTASPFSLVTTFKSLSWKGYAWCFGYFNISSLAHIFSPDVIVFLLSQTRAILKLMVKKVVCCYVQVAAFAYPVLHCPRFLAVPYCLKNGNLLKTRTLRRKTRDFPRVKIHFFCGHHFLYIFWICCYKNLCRPFMVPNSRQVPRYVPTVLN